MAGMAVWSLRCQRVTLVCLLGLLAVIAINTLIAPSHARAPNVVVWLAVSLPLVIFLPGVWRGNVQSFAWLSFVSLLYFAQSVTALFEPAWRSLDVLHLLFSVVLFVGAMLSVRYTARAKRAAS